MDNINGNSPHLKKVIASISRDRVRTNLLRNYEQPAIAFLVQRIPSWISSDMLTAIGFFGSMIVFGSFVLASMIHIAYLLLGIPGFAISWFGDSLDGRIAYYRNKPRKNYGFTLDITIDWISIILIGSGYIIYAQGIWEFFGYGFVVMYGWEMIIALMRYRITGKYSIDSGKMGPTEVRIILSAIMITEVILPDSITYLAAIACFVLFFINIADTRTILKTADETDVREKSRKLQREEALVN